MGEKGSFSVDLNGMYPSKFTRACVGYGNMWPFAELIPPSSNTTCSGRPSYSIALIIAASPRVNSKFVRSARKVELR